MKFDRDKRSFKHILWHRLHWGNEVINIDIYSECYTLLPYKTLNVAFVEQTHRDKSIFFAEKGGQ